MSLSLANNTISSESSARLPTPGSLTFLRGLGTFTIGGRRKRLGVLANHYRPTGKINCAERYFCIGECANVRPNHCIDIHQPRHKYCLGIRNEAHIYAHQ
jgi:hypothetical protein